MFNYKIIILSIIGFVLCQGVEKAKYPKFFSSNPPVSFLDCLYRFFACSDDHTYGKWPMNARVCLRDYQVCTAERKWNQKETDYGRVKITRPIINPNHQTENGSYLTPRIVDYLYSFSCFDTICGNQRKKLSCGSNGKIKLYFVFYGRAEKDECSANLSHLDFLESCIVEDAVSSVYKDCNGQNECVVSTRNLDPKYCVNYYPYLQVKYTCTNFNQIIPSTSEPYNSSFSGSMVVDGKIDTCFFSKFQKFPWMFLKFPKHYKVKEVLVFAKKGEDYVELSNYEVKLSNIANFDFSTDRHNCIKKTKWDLTFLCGSANLYMGAMVYSTGIGIMAVKEVTFILIKDGGIDEDKKKIPYDRSDKNIYSIIDKSCSKELLDVSCESYGGNIEIIEHIVGRTRGICDSANQDLECFERIPGILPSCIQKPICAVHEDRVFRDTVNSFKAQLKCTGINFFEIRYTCTGLPKPIISTSSVDNGFSPDNLIYKEEFETNYFSSQFEDNPWIQVSFKKTLAVVGIQFTIPVSTDSARDFEDIYVRVGDKYVLEKSDLSGNPICGNFRGPPKPDQTHIVVTCGVNDNFLTGNFLTIQKNGRGVLQIKDIVVLLVPESNIKETTHIGGFLIEALFCDDEALLTCERSGAGVILTVDAYAGQTLDNGVCNPQNSIVDIKTSDCERSHKSIVKNNCEGQRKCMIDLTGTETCPIETKYRRILYRCTNFERPIGRASSVESKDHAPQFALDGKIVFGNAFLFKSKLGINPWFEVDMKGVYIVKALEIVFGDIINIQRSIELNVLNSPYVPEDSDSLNNDYDGFFRNDRLVSNQTSFRGPRRSSLCAYIDLIPDPTYVYIHCNRKVAGKYVVLIVKEFTVLVLQEIVILLAGDSAL